MLYQIIQSLSTGTYLDIDVYDTAAWNCIIELSNRSAEIKAVLWIFRKIVVFWTPGKNLLSNSAIPCIHADPYFGDLKPGESRSARGVLIFTRTSLEELVQEFAEKAEQPW